MRKKTTLFLLILTLSIYASNINVQISAEENNYRPSSLELTPHETIEITSDSNFTDYGFLGTGTVEDPYLIYGYNITTTSQNGIYITLTTKYFVIRNCYVDGGLNGIYIGNVADGTATIINNTCNNNVYGIWLEDSGNSTVANNTCNNNGIWLWFSGNSTVANNTCNNNGCDILLYSSGSSTVINNTFTNCGLFIYEITIDAYLTNTVEKNWVNGKKLGFYTNLDTTTIAEPIYGQLILVNCINVTVRDQILNNATDALSLYFCTYSVIINNTCINNYSNGIVFYNSDNCVVTNNLLQGNRRCGVKISNLLIENEYHEIEVYSSDDNLIHHNTFVDNNGGFSQAYDEGRKNKWYDPATQEGNYWSNWSGKGSYAIYGSAGAVDIYPLDEHFKHSTDETQIFFTSTLLMVVVSLLLTRIISKKVKKEID